MDKVQLAQYIRQEGGLGNEGSDDDVISYASSTNKDIAELAKQVAPIKSKSGLLGGDKATMQEPSTWKNVLGSIIRPINQGLSSATKAATLGFAPIATEKPIEETSGGQPSIQSIVEKGASALGEGAGSLALGEGIGAIAPKAMELANPLIKRIGGSALRPVTNIKNWIKSDKFASKVNGEFWAKEAAGNTKYGEILAKANPTTVIKTLGAEVVENPEYLKEPTMKILSELGDTASVQEVQTAINKINKYIPKTSYSISARPEDIANMEVVHNLRTLLTDNVDELKAFKPEWAKNKEIFKKLSKFMTDIDKTEIGIRKGLNTGDTKTMKKMIDQYFDTETVRQLGGYSRLYKTVEYLKKNVLPLGIAGGAGALLLGVKK